MEYLQRAKDYAISRGGECLATEYVTAKTKTEWKCSNPAHPVFSADFQIVSRGSWCTLCGNEATAKKYSRHNGLELAKDYAISRGGECKSTEYVNARTNMVWECRTHGMWESCFYHMVNTKQWCKQCGYDKALIKEFDKQAEQYASSKGGSCILPEDRKVKTATMIEWKCSNLEHKKWIGTFRNVVIKGGWCPYCAGKFSQNEYLEKAKEYALTKNGQCLSNEYLDQKEKMIWSCNTHGIWEESYKNVIARNLWCSKCRNILTPAEYLEKARQHAINKDGLCLSVEYIDQKSKIIWSCNTHGQWESDYGNIVVNDRWCPECFKKEKQLSCLSKAHEYAKSLGGECLTTTFNANSDMFEWKCQYDRHPKWQSKYNTVLGNKSWCPECGIYYQKENQFRKILEYLLGFRLDKAKPEWNINPKSGHLLELDGYNDQHKFAFEYQGRQHYQDNIFANSNQTLEYTQYKDKIKYEHCIEQGVTLLVIDGRKKVETASRMLKFIQKQLDQIGLIYKQNINLEEVKNIFNAARTQGWDSKNKIRLKN